MRRMAERPRVRARQAGEAVIPIVALIFYAGLTFARSAGVALHPVAGTVLVLPVLLAAAIAAVSHAEDLAHRAGEPYGTLILTVAVTLIEAALIIPSAFGSGGDPGLPRDTVFSTVMIVCNGLVGLCILMGGILHREQEFDVKGASAYLAVLSVLCVLTLVLPSYTAATPGPWLSPSQLFFVALVTLLLYGVFLYIQTVRHAEFFTASLPQHQASGGLHEPTAMRRAALLFLSLLAAVLLAKSFAAYMTPGLAAIGAPSGFTGFCVALLVLLPESLTALRASYRNQLQRSINLALGSALATIGLTVPAVAVISLYLGRNLVLGLRPQATVLLALTLLVSMLTFGTGRTNLLYGFVHLIIFATYMLLIFLP